MKNNIQKFAAPWSLRLKILTIATVLVVFGVMCYWMGARTLEIAWILLLLLPGAFFAPRGYVVTDSSIIVRRWLGPKVVVPIESVEDIKRVSREDIGPLLSDLGIHPGAVREFFGSYGVFSSSRLGKFKGYITNTNSLVLIQYDNGKKLVLSPERPEKFMDAVVRHLSSGKQTQKE